MGGGKIPLVYRIGIGFVLGVAAGAVFGQGVQVIAPVGTIFLNLLRMLIVPLVFASLAVGTASLKDVAALGRLGVRTLALYLITTAVAISIGLVLGNLVQPGAGMNLDLGSAQFKAPEVPKLVDVLVGIFPSNPVDAMVKANMLQIIVFALFVGVAMVKAGERAAPLHSALESLAETMYSLTAIVMEFAPFGVFALISGVVARHGLSVLAPFSKLIAAVYLGCLLHAAIIYSGMLRWMAGVSPLKFFSAVKDAALMAFVTRSSSATLPVTMRVTREGVGVSERVSGFVLPLGATINMDGTALYQGVCALFVAQAFGIPLSVGQQLSIILTATLASIGTAGVPGAGLIMLTMVLSAAGLPVEAVALIAGVDVVLDMARTSINVTGDAVVATVVARGEGESLKL